MSASLSKKSRRYGAVVVFERSVTREQAEAALDELAKRGLVRLADTSNVEEFDERLGGPVWYLP